MELGVYQQAVVSVCLLQLVEEIVAAAGMKRKLHQKNIYFLYKCLTNAYLLPLLH